MKLADFFLLFRDYVYDYMSNKHEMPDFFCLCLRFYGFTAATATFFRCYNLFRSPSCISLVYLQMTYAALNKARIRIPGFSTKL